MTHIAFILISILLGVYAILLLVPGLFFALEQKGKAITIIPKTFISVLIPVRNEENEIADCLLSLTQLNYPKDLLEIVVIDDHSTDRTKFIVQKFAAEYPSIKLLENLPDAFGKKLALTQGVGYAKGELIATTDGDCILPKDWLLEIESAYKENEVNFIAGPVMYKKSKMLLRDILEIEQIALQAVSGGALQLGFPIMCSGANLAYRRDFFIRSGGYSEDRFASGDDISLMEKARKLGADKMCFMKRRGAIVETSAVRNLQEVIQQRSRWVSKFSAHPSFSITTTGIIVFLMNFSLLFFGLFSLCNNTFLNTFILALIGKMFIDLLLLSLAVPFFREPRLFLMAIPAGIFYPMLAMVSSIRGLSGKYKWKNRILKT